MMENKTCKDCLHCSIENTDEVYCTGMPWHYPFGGSDTVSLDKEACEHFLERDEPTVFQRITASPEVLADKLVYTWGHLCHNGDVKIYWKSTILPDAVFYSKYEAITATLEELNKVSK